MKWGWSLWLFGLAALGLGLLAGAVQAAPQTDEKSMKTAVFSGGCFWCMESEFESEKGVVSTVSGYTGGQTRNPTYEEVSGGKTGHYEAILVTYDPKVVNYRRLLEIFWSNVDPLDAKGQFVDQGSQYRAAVFVGDKAEAALAERSKTAVSQRLQAPVVTAILPRGTFYPAEDYHQDYARKSAVRYELYHAGSGREKRLETLKARAGGVIYDGK